MPWPHPSGDGRQAVVQLARHHRRGAGPRRHHGQQAAAGADVQAVRLAVLFLLPLDGPRDCPLVSLMVCSDTRQLDYQDFEAYACVRCQSSSA